MKNSALKNGTVVKYYSRAGELVGTGVICGSGEKNGMCVYDVDMPNGGYLLGLSRTVQDRKPSGQLIWKISLIPIKLMTGSL